MFMKPNSSRKQSSQTYSKDASESFDSQKLFGNDSSKGLQLIKKIPEEAEDSENCPETEKQANFRQQSTQKKTQGIRAWKKENSTILNEPLLKNTPGDNTSIECGGSQTQQKKSLFNNDPKNLKPISFAVPADNTRNGSTRNVGLENLTSVSLNGGSQNSVDKNFKINLSMNPNETRSCQSIPDIPIPDIDKTTLDEEFLVVLRSRLFILLYMILSYTIACPMFFSMNVKTFGLANFGDAAITKIGFLGCAIMFTSKLTSGYLLDKYGLIKIFKISLGLSMVAIL